MSGWIRSVAALASLCVLAGCSMFDREPSLPSREPTPSSTRPTVSPTTAPPAFKDVAARYNARVSKLDRIAASADLSVTRPGDDGQMQTDRIEGYMQFRRPRMMNLRIDKVGNTLFVMGSNQEQFWWFDLGDDHRGWYGTHAKAPREAVDRFGVPVQPADLAELLGILPLDTNVPGRMSWSPDGKRVRVVMPSSRGPRRIEVDPVTFEPARIELLDEYGDVAVTADLAKYEVVPVRGDTQARPKLATVFDVRIPRQRTQMSIKLTGVENPAEKQKDVNFDFETLTERYGVERLDNLDEWKPRPPARTNASVPMIRTPAGQPAQLPPSQSPTTAPKTVTPNSVTPKSPATQPAAQPNTQPAWKRMPVPSRPVPKAPEPSKPAPEQDEDPK